MNILENMLKDERWDAFLEDKRGQDDFSAEEFERFERFITDRGYRPYVEKMRRGEPFSAPRKIILSKTGSTKKRIVYSFPFEENVVLKMLAQELHAYDGLFGSNLYSFRLRNGVRQAIGRLAGACRRRPLYSFKIDISNYFNSIPVGPMSAMLRARLDDEPLCRFLEAHLTAPEVVWQDEVIREDKGVMAGTPVSPFLANLYLADLDEAFEGELYARYSDDIILFAETEPELDALSARLMDFVRAKGLTLNPSKVTKTAPGEAWTFLGITYRDGETDISDVSMKKLKDKLHRKARALARWKRKKGVSAEKAMRAYLRAVNRKLYDNPKQTELTWARWYFPLISTDGRLKELDRYIQACVRYVKYENYGKKTYNLRYEDIKALGFRSLVHEYYLSKEEP